MQDRQSQLRVFRICARILAITRCGKIPVTNKINLNGTYRFSPQREVNALHLGYAYRNTDARS